MGEVGVGIVEWLERQWIVLHESPAQSSIGWDVVWTTASFLVWVLATGGSVSPSRHRHPHLAARATRTTGGRKGTGGGKGTKGGKGTEGDQDNKEEGDKDEVGVWDRVWKVAYLVFVTPIASVGVTGAYVLRPARLDSDSDDEVDGGA
ncbi:hypothetical protein NMY22_g18672 [Coprinellus aureogranulatus]|nr:hypothetical protein NMY22_g18672 [Coprinellus aureogranulatus]